MSCIKGILVGKASAFEHRAIPRFEEKIALSVSNKHSIFETASTFIPSKAPPAKQLG